MDRSNMNDNWRLYGLVPYNLSPIQQGIQFGHAVQEFNNLVMDAKIPLDEIPNFNQWRKQSKTFIILNGGTTNDSTDYPGSMNENLKELIDMGITVAQFYEPDLGDQLTAVVFLVPNTVYNKTIVPDFWDWVDTDEMPFEQIDLVKFKFGELFIRDFDKKQLKTYKQWEELVGGEKYARLRFFLSRFRLA